MTRRAEEGERAAEQLRREQEGFVGGLKEIAGLLSDVAEKAMHLINGYAGKVGKAEPVVHEKPKKLDVRVKDGVQEISVSNERSIGKVCPRCKVPKAAMLFGSDASRPDGLQFYCKACKHEQIAARKTGRRASGGKLHRRYAKRPEGYEFEMDAQRIIDGHKLCTAGGFSHVARVADFPKATASKTGLQWWCRFCIKHKKCPHCGIDKRGYDFGRARKTSDRLQYWCRKCRVKAAQG